MKTNLSNLKIAVIALGMLFSKAASAQFTAVVSGPWSDAATWGGAAPTATVLGQNITIPSGIGVSLDADVTFTGLLNTFQVNGTLTSTSANQIVMTQGALTGSGNISISKLKFTSLATTSFGGTLNIKHMTNTIGSLAFTAIANISDTLDLENGSILLNTNANLSMSSGSTIKVGDGSLVVNAGILNTSNSYNVMYVGTSKTTGVELNTMTLQNMHLRLSNNSQKVTLASATMINGNLDMGTGSLDLDGKKLTLKGDLISGTGATIESDNTSEMVIEGSGTLTGSLMFSSGSSIKNLVIKRTTNGQVKLASAIDIKENLDLTEGSLSIESNGTLTMLASSNINVQKGTLSTNSGNFVAAAAYNASYSGSSDVTSGTELSGSGLTNVSVNYDNNANKVTLSNNVSVTGKLVMTKGKMDLSGKNLILNGSVDQSPNASFVGNPSSELHLNLNSISQDSIFFDNSNANAQTLSKLKVNITSTNAITLGSKLIIGNELTFLSGMLVLGNGDLEIMPSASIQGYDDTKYIITSNAATGALVQNVTSGSAYVAFPVGLSANYSPAYVQQTATGTTGNFRVKCETLASSLTGVKAVDRTWMIEGAAVTTVNANLKFGWQVPAEMNSFDRTNAYVSHFTSSSWDATTASSATVGLNGTYELSRMGLTSLSPFAVAEGGQVLKIKELSKLEGIELYPNPSKDVLNIKVLNSSNDYSYELIDLTGRVVLSTTNNNSVNKFDVSSLGSGCYFIKITNLEDNKTDTRRFIKQ